jgi:hypothetical protein
VYYVVRIQFVPRGKHILHYEGEPVPGQLIAVGCEDGAVRSTPETVWIAVMCFDAGAGAGVACTVSPAVQVVLYMRKA